MGVKSNLQREHLLNLARHISALEEPLGVGLKRGCWAGVAIQIARAQQSKATDYYGLSMREIKVAIKLNNATRPALRNSRMIDATLQHAVS